MTPGPGMGYYRPRVELAPKLRAKSGIGRSVGLGISTLCGEISIVVLHPCSFLGCRSSIQIYVDGL